MTFHDWLERKYIEWKGETQRNFSQFAVYLGVSQPTVSGWMNETRKQPNMPRIINSLAAKLGPEIYDILGIERPGDDPTLTEWTQLFLRADLDQRKLLLENAKRLLEVRTTQ